MNALTELFWNWFAAEKELTYARDIEPGNTFGYLDAAVNASDELLHEAQSAFTNDEARAFLGS